ncbi:MAG TPA: RluA family pseudouridine synthase [Desulfuromonadales bacterium]|nr:RluA family pseudouridine synthase [Desulfuromonadales bacterium]
MPRTTYRFTPNAEDAGMRLDQFVAGRSADLSRTLVRKLVDLGGVHIGGRRTRRCSYPVQAGEIVEIYVDGLPLEPYQVEAAAVVYRDSYLIGVDKPAGVETQPTPARFKGTLYAALLDYLHDPFRPQQAPELGMVQRLDRDTSGVMVFSIHPRAHRGLTEAFAGRQARKRYLALVAGRMTAPEGEFRSMLARSRATNKVKSVERGGKEAVTIYRVLEEFAAATLVEVEIVTGRSHQIRAHFAESGHPLLGDQRYGGSVDRHGYPIRRQMLHSWRLSLKHPVSGQPLELEAPIPADMAGLLAELRCSKIQ